MKRFSYVISLTVQAPFLFPGINAGRYGLDKVALRDRNRNLILPQDQLRGVIMEAAKELLGDDDPRVRSLFGHSSGDANADEDVGFEPMRTRLFFADLVGEVDAQSKASAPYHRVSIDKDSGAAKPGQLVMLEQSAKPGSPISFSGPLTLYADEAEVEFIEKLMARALEVPLTIGSHASIGFGRILKTDSKAPTKIEDQRPLRGIPTDTRLEWRFRIDRPYLVDAMRIANNAYQGAPVIPGGALKGCLARNLELAGHNLKDGPLAAALATIRIGHARKVGSPAPLPMSIVEVGDNNERVDLLQHALSAEQSVPTFGIDWKSKSGDGDQASLDFDERVHTRIETASQTASNAALFSTIAIDPKGRSLPGGPDPLAENPDYDLFSCEIDFLEITGEARQAIEDVLTRGIDGLGRTNASVLTDSFSVVSEPAIPRSGRAIIRVCSPALMADYSDGENTKEAYVNFWNSQLPNSIFKDFYARQEIRGGYQSRRFTLGDAMYRNWLLTVPGSVFEIDIHSEDVGRLRELLRFGVCRNKLNGEPLTWRNCPFVAENGFGEIDLVDGTT